MAALQLCSAQCQFSSGSAEQNLSGGLQLLLCLCLLSPTFTPEAFGFDSASQLDAAGIKALMEAHLHEVELQQDSQSRFKSGS